MDDFYDKDPFDLENDFTPKELHEKYDIKIFVDGKEQTDLKGIHKTFELSLSITIKLCQKDTGEYKHTYSNKKILTEIGAGSIIYVFKSETSNKTSNKNIVCKVMDIEATDEKDNLIGRFACKYEKTACEKLKQKEIPIIEFEDKKDKKDTIQIASFLSVFDTNPEPEYGIILMPHIKNTITAKIKDITGKPVSALWTFNKDFNETQQKEIFCNFIKLLKNVHDVTGLILTDLKIDNIGYNENYEYSFDGTELLDNTVIIKPADPRIAEVDSFKLELSKDTFYKFKWIDDYLNSENYINTTDYSNKEVFNIINKKNIFENIEINNTKLNVKQIDTYKKFYVYDYGSFMEKDKSIFKTPYSCGINNPPSSNTSLLLEELFVFDLDKEKIFEDKKEAITVDIVNLINIILSYYKIFKKDVPIKKNQDLIYLIENKSDEPYITNFDDGFVKYLCQDSIDLTNFLPNKKYVQIRNPKKNEKDKITINNTPNDKSIFYFDSNLPKSELNNIINVINVTESIKFELVPSNTIYNERNILQSIEYSVTGPNYIPMSDLQKLQEINFAESYQFELKKTNIEKYKLDTSDHSPALTPQNLEAQPTASENPQTTRAGYSTMRSSPQNQPIQILEGIKPGSVTDLASKFSVGGSRKRRYNRKKSKKRNRNKKKLSKSKSRSKSRFNTKSSKRHKKFRNRKSLRRSKKRLS